MEDTLEKEVETEKVETSEKETKPTENATFGGGDEWDDIENALNDAEPETKTDKKEAKKTAEFKEEPENDEDEEVDEKRLPVFTKAMANDWAEVITGMINTFMPRMFVWVAKDEQTEKNRKEFAMSAPEEKRMKIAWRMVLQHYFKASEMNPLFLLLIIMAGFMIPNILIALEKRKENEELAKEKKRNAELEEQLKLAQLERIRQNTAPKNPKPDIAPNPANIEPQMVFDPEPQKGKTLEDFAKEFTTQQPKKPPKESAKKDRKIADITPKTAEQKKKENHEFDMEIIRLRGEGMTQTQIAKEMGVADSTITRRLERIAKINAKKLTSENGQAKDKKT